MATNTTHATSQASVSESNRSRIVKHLYHNGISSRAQIAKALELTPAAITKITARLIEAGMIEETGDLEGSKNRRSIGLKLNTTHFRIIGIKFARSLVQIGVFDLCGNTLSFEQPAHGVRQHHQRLHRHHPPARRTTARQRPIHRGHRHGSARPLSA